MFQDVSESIQPHRTSYAKSRILDPIQNSTGLIVFQDFRIAKFRLDSIMYEGMELAFNQAHQPLYVP